MRRIPVYILHLEPHRFRGAVVMRCHQLAEIGDMFLSERYEFHVRAVCGPKQGDQRIDISDLRDGIVILSKSAIAHLGAPAFELLKSRNIAIAADWIDRGLRAPMIDEIDIHIAASKSFERHARTRRPGDTVMPLTHHADLRLHNLRFLPHTRLAPVYLGHNDNLSAPESVRRQLTIAQAKRDSQFSEFLPRLPEFNLHYNVRPMDRTGGESFKPLTKGFTAAACRSNMIVQRDVDDVLDYLGADYPYLIENDDAQTVETAMAYAKESFGGPDWIRGLHIMRDVYARSSPAHIAGELDAILALATGNRATWIAA